MSENKTQILVTIVEGIDGSGKTTYVKNLELENGPDIDVTGKTILKLTQKYPTVYPQDWSAVDADFFLNQMVETKFGLSQITPDMIETYDIIHLVLDRSFISTAVYQNDISVVNRGLLLMFKEMYAFDAQYGTKTQYRLCHLTEDIEICADRVLQRDTAKEITDPQDKLDRTELIASLRDLHNKFCAAVEDFHQSFGSCRRFVNVVDCLVCGKDHPMVEYAPLTFVNPDPALPNYWFICPEYDQPHWIWEVELDPQLEETE